MKIIKYKKLNNNRYKVTLDSMELELYEEVILKYNLLITKEIDPKELDSITKDNIYYEIYYIALDSIKKKTRSIYDIRELLIKKELPRDLIDRVIEKLINQSYLNDVYFATSFVNKELLTTLNGPNKMRQELTLHHVDSNIITYALNTITEEECIDRIEKLASRFYKSNRNKGGRVLRGKITMNLISYGYNNNLIDKVLDNYDFETNKDMVKKEYDKLYRKLSRKYSGSELDRRIKQSLYMKGLQYEEN